MKQAGIILTTFNFPEKSRRCLESFHETAGYPYHLVIVDNNSGTDQLDDLHARSNYLITNPADVSLSRALNQGLTYLLEQREIGYIGWIHNDMLFFRHWLERLVQTLDSHPEIGKLAPYNFTGEPARVTEVIAEEFMQKNRDIIRPANACPWLCPRGAVEETGFFDEGYLRCGGYEDWDYNNRMLERGYSVMITRASVVWHETMGTRKHIEQKEAEVANSGRYFSKWGPGPRV
jgi:GT2 family glycosyltransferase